MVIELDGADWRLWLDREAVWREDPIHLPGVDVSQLPCNEPTCGWASMYATGRDVGVPGTVEEYLWDELGGDYVGVSWWCRDFDVAPELVDRKLVLEFSAVRQRAEIFLNEKPVGYDAVGNTPFRIDVTGRVAAGPNRLAVRITDPGGNFDWRDYTALQWGERTIPMSHGFGGITGPVRLIATDQISIDDVFVRNAPSIMTVGFELGVSNSNSQAESCDLRIGVRDSDGAGVFERMWNGITIAPGRATVEREITVPEARPWSPDAPHLYVATIELVGHDRVEQRFGFRWFGVEGVGQDAKFRLNGKRIVLRSAISWGFWPVTGIYPKADLARENVRIAKALGLNMLNMHRCIGDTATFDAADELGLLIFEEPGGYTSRGGDETCFALAREKLLRIVRRDRSRPSLVIYNMINEETSPPTERERRDMADAHALDPTRTITYTSGWAKDGDDPIKLHTLPLDSEQRTVGWYDSHHAPGPGVYRDSSYNGPNDYRWRRSDRREIVFWGEEGAIATPPRLGRIAETLETWPNGWDGADYRAWAAAFEGFLDDKKLRAYFPTVDKLTETLGDIAYYYQGRIIENVRAGDGTDGYVINGWESEKLENHSGMVDCFRNAKGRPELLAYYNRPLLLAVKLRNKVGAAPMAVTCDVYVVNEVDLRGEYELEMRLCDPTGAERWRNRFDVTVTGGDLYGELLLRDLAVRIDGGAGRYVLRGALRRKVDGGTAAELIVEGDDEAFVVDRPTAPPSQRGAVIDSTGTVRRFLSERLKTDFPDFETGLPPLDTIVLAGDGDLIRREPIPADAVLLPDGSKPGLVGAYYHGWDFDRFVFEREDQGVQHDFGGVGPDPRLGGRDYSIRWKGLLRPPASGPYIFHAEHDDGIRVTLDGREVIGHWDPFAAPRNDSGHSISLEAGRDYDLRIEYFQSGGGAHMRLSWTTPAMLSEHDRLVDSLLERAQRDGTTLLVVANADQWAELFSRRGAIEYAGRMNHGRFWLGGNFFVRSHPLFAGLPVNCGMDWEYQEIVNYDRRRFGLRLSGEEVVAGCVTGNEHEVATAVGVIVCGRGRIVLSTLDLLPVLNDEAGPADVARTIFCNYLRFASKRDGAANR